MYDLPAMSTKDWAAIIAAASAICGGLVAAIRWVLGNVKATAQFEQSQHDAQMQHDRDIARLEADIAALRKRIDDYFQQGA